MQDPTEPLLPTEPVEPLLPTEPKIAPLSERVAGIVAATPPDEAPIDERVGQLNSLYHALSEDDPDAGLMALWALVQTLELADRVDFELEQG